MYKTKRINNSIKDVDVKSGIVTGYIAHFGNIDKVGDVITEKAFNKTLSDNNKKYMLYNHSWLNVVGIFDVLKADKNGLYFEKNLLKSFNIAGEKISNTQAKDLLTLYAEGAINKHSIGYSVVHEEKKEDANYLTEIKLYEGSALTVEAANPLTPFLGFKSCKNLATQKNNIEKQIEKINKLLLIKELSDELKLKLNMSFLQLEQMIKQINEPSNIDTQKSNIDTQKNEPSKIKHILFNI